MDEIEDSIKRGIPDAAAGRVVDRGDFTQYADDEIEDEDE